MNRQLHAGLPRGCFVTLFLAAVVLLNLLAAGPVTVAGPAAMPSPSNPDVSGIQPGMKAEEVLSLLGPPQHVSRQILYTRYLEQWVYDTPRPLRIQFDWRKGEERRIQTVQPLPPGPR